MSGRLASIGQVAMEARMGNYLLDVRKLCIMGGRGLALRRFVTFRRYCGLPLAETLGQTGSIGIIDRT